MKRKRFYILISLTIFTLTGCGNSKETISEASMDLQDTKTVLANTADHIIASLSQDDKQLIIDADIIAGETDTLFEITVKTDENQVQKFISEQVLTKYPEIKEKAGENGSRDWSYSVDEQLQFSCTLDEDGTLGYLDVSKDINAPFLDGDHVYEYGYITELGVPGADMSASETAKKITLFLAEYSAFDFQPWNILAVDSPDNSEKSGYYSVSMQPVYKGLPISIKHDSAVPWFSTTISYSSEGIFSIQGLFLLSESKSTELKKIVSLDSILEKFKASFSAFACGDTISVTRVMLEYFSQMNEDGSYTLTPVWNIYCNDSRTEVINNEKKEILLRYNNLYYAEDGELCGVYY